MKKRLFSAILSLAMLLTLLPTTALAAEPASGSCGSGVTWSYDGKGTLKIDGSGTIPDYSHEWEESPAPWWEYRTEITTIIVGNNIKRIGNEAFGGGPYRAGYPQLASITIGTSVKEIGAYAFSGAGSITKITLPSQLTAIEDGAFYGSSLTEITIPQTVENIAETAFLNCTQLSSISVNSENDYYASGGGVLYEKLFGNKYVLICYPSQKPEHSYTILEGTIKIADEAFASNTNLTSIVVPNSVTEIPDLAFAFCSALVKVDLPDGIASVSSSAFAVCTALEELHIPASVEKFTAEYTVGEWFGETYQPLSVYFYGNKAPAFDGAIADLRDSTCPVTIYYPANATGWSAVQQQDNLRSAIENGTLQFKTWHPASGGDPETPPTSDKATILRTYPVNGADDVGYDASDEPYFEITFDRDISAVTTKQGYIFADLDFSKGSMKIFRSADDMLIYEVTYDDYMNDWYEIAGTISSDTRVRNGNTLELKPFNAHTLLTAGTDYYVTVDEGFIRFEDGTVNQEINKGQWAFKTATADYFSTTEDITISTGDKEKPTATVSAEWDDGWFATPATSTYNHDLAITSLVLSGAAYVESAGQPSSQSIRAALTAFEFDEIQSYNYNYQHTDADNDVVAYTFAVKRIEDISYDTTYLVAIVIKGTSGNEEWYSNFNIGTGRVHEGFDLAKEELMDRLEDYLSELGLTSAYKENTKFLVTGHSRGAAVANLVAADLSYSSHAERANVYGYTFATPAVSTVTGSSYYAYNNIINIISGEDFITQVPLSQWNYRQYGVNLLLPSKSYYLGEYESIYRDMEYVYESIVGKPFESFNGTEKVDNLVAYVYKLAPSVEDYYTRRHSFSPGVETTVDAYFQMIASIVIGWMSFGASDEVINLIASEVGDFRNITNFFLDNHVFNHRLFSAHSIAGYYSWMRSCSASVLFGDANESTYRTFRRLTIACPVNIYVYNETGTLVASVVNETVEVDTLAVNVDDGVKVIDLPTDQNYSIKIIATGDGTMDYTVQELSAEATGNTILRTVFFDDIELAIDDTFTSEINDSLNTSTQNYALTKNESEMIYATDDSLQTDQGDDNPSSIPDTSPATYSITLPDSFVGGSISVQPKYAQKGSTVTITVTPDEGYELDELTVTDSKGNKLELTDKESGKYTFKMPAGRVEIEVSFREIVLEPVNPFTDVITSYYYYDAVLWSVENGVTNGTSATTFSPNMTVSRAQMVTFLWRAHGSPKATGANPFTDVSESAYYYDAVLWAVANGVTSGTSATTFSPDMAVTRAQAVTFQWRAAGSPTTSGNSFHDVATDAYYADAVTWAVANGITNGTGSNTFSPNLAVSRAQAVTFLYRELAD